MLTKFIQTTPLAVALTCTLCSAAHADTSGSQQSQVDAVTQRNVHGTRGGKHPMHNSNGAGVFVTADFIYWRANEDGLEFAFKADSIPTHGLEFAFKADSIPTPGIVNPQPVIDGKLKDLDFEWDPGFRLGLGYTFNYDGWDLYLNWTRLHSTASGSETCPTIANPLTPPPTNIVQNTLTSPWLPHSLGIFAQKISGHWSISYNTLDLELGRNYFASKAISYRPFIGLRAAWLLQDYSNKVHGLPLSFPEEPSTIMKAHNDYRGLGLRAGFHFLYHLNQNWGLYGDISGSILWGEFHVNSKVRGPNTFANSELETLFSVKREFHRVRTNLDVGAGIQWETFFNRDRMHFAFSAGYELVQWYMQNQLGQYVGWGSGTIGKGFNFPQIGDLGFQGLTVSARIDF